MAAEQFSVQEQASLAGRIHAGDAAAEEEFVRWFGGKVFLMMVARTRDRETAGDLAQEVLFTVLRALRDGQLREGGRLAAYVHGTARNIVNNYLRERGRRPVEVPVDPELVVQCPPDEFESSERLGLVRRALGQLDATDQRILLLTLVEGLKPGDIAVRLNVTPEAVRTRKSRAVKKVTETIKKMSRK
jgi:RNA polymerase sigma-70 factor, ECF subfamily